MAVNLSMLAGAGAQFFDNSGVILSGGLVYTYAAGTTTPQAAYTTSAGSIAHSNPIVLDSAGRVASGGEIWLTDAVAYKFVLKTATATTIGTYDNITGNASGIYAAFAASSGSSLVGFIQSGTGAVATTVQAKLRESVSVLDFGAKGDGTTDDTAAINAAALAVSSAGGLVFFPPGTYKTTAAINLYSKVTYYGAGSASVIACTNGNINQFYGTGLSECTVRELKISATSVGTTAYVGAINFESSTNCYVTNIELVGMAWAGVLLSNSSYCKVSGVYAHGWQGSIQDSADINVFRVSQFNTIDGNFLYGGGWHGVLVQDPGTSLIPSKNIITNNRVGAHAAYGIITYNIDTADSFTQINNNYVEGILGSVLANSSGAGIYVQNSGGAIVTGNTVKNCCINTSNVTLTPAGIAFNNISAGLSPCICSDNNIIDIVNYFGIEVASSVGSVSITGNVIRLINNTSSNTIGVYINAASNCTVTGNNIILSASTNTIGIALSANGVATNNTVIQGNNIVNSGYAGIRTLQVGAFLNYVVTITGNICTTTSATSIPLIVNSGQSFQVTGNVFTANAAYAATLTSTTIARFANNQITSTGSLAFVTSGTCTSSFYDMTNYNGAVTAIQNAATGCIVQQLNNAAPATSSWAVGDRMEQSVPVVGQPKGWRCTVAGAPGTWVSEGNL